MNKIILALITLLSLMNTAFVFEPDCEHFMRLFGEHDSATGFVLLPHADAGYLDNVPHDTVSFLGAANPAFPLYVNGELIAQGQITDDGFFALHRSLERGNNSFLFENGGFTREVVVRRGASESWGTSRRTNFTTPVYGRATSGNISRYYDNNDDNHGTPLARGTVFRIIAEQGESYILADGSFVYSNRVERISQGELDDDSLNLYSVVVDGNNATLTEYDFEGNPTQHEYSFDRAISGHYFKDGEIIFTHPPQTWQEVRVLIDAGHGGTDPGALGPPGRFGLMEKDFNLIVAAKTVALLRERGIQTTFLRDTDDFIPVLERMEVFEETPYDLVLSVHANSMSVHRDFNSSTGPLMYYTLDESREAANSIIEHIAAATGHEYTPAIRRNFAMARNTAGASMLFEMGFMCNPADYERMLDASYLELLAQSLADGVIAHFTELGVTDAATETDTPTASSENSDNEETEATRGTWVRHTKPVSRTAERQNSGDMSDFVIVVLMSALVMYRIQLKQKKR